MNKIIHQKQITPTSCVSACLSMALVAFNGNEDDKGQYKQQSIINNFQDDYFNARTNEIEYLSSLVGSWFVREAEYNEQLEWDKVYMICVPSLNIKGGTHAIIWDLRRSIHGEKTKIFDPNEGIEGKEFYIVNDGDSESEKAFKITSWTVSFEFLIDSDQ